MFFTIAFNASTQLLFLLLDMVDAGALNLRLLRRFVGLLVKAVPPALPLVHGAFGGLQTLARLFFAGARLFQQGTVALKFIGKLLQLALILLTERLGLFQRLLGLLQIDFLLATRFASVLNGFFKARDIRAQGIKLSLHLVEALVGFHVRGALAFDAAFDLTLLGNRALQGVFLLGNLAIALLDVFTHARELERQQLGTCAALFLLKGFVFFRSRCLTLEMAQLLLHLFTQIVEALEVFAGVADAILGLAAALLVL